MAAESTLAGARVALAFTGEAVMWKGAAVVVPHVLQLVRNVFQLEKAELVCGPLEMEVAIDCHLPITLVLPAPFRQTHFVTASEDGRDLNQVLNEKQLQLIADAPTVQTTGNWRAWSQRIARQITHLIVIGNRAEEHPLWMATKTLAIHKTIVPESWIGHPTRYIRFLHPTLSLETSDS